MRIPEQRQPTAWYILIILAFVVLFIVTSYKYNLTDRMFPLMVGYFAVPLLLMDLLSLTDTKIGGQISLFFSGKSQKQVDEDADPTPRTLGQELIIFVWMGALVLGIYLIGFLPCTPVFVYCWMKYRGGYSVRQSAYLAIGTIVFVYVLFELILQYELYPGIFLYWYG
ncbi:MAG: hypothetical protein CMM52_12320 [Rhodospirillaceae bacterium]|nr:hypothetical protein [Rhodospirillaceae bacterium]|tara:strand:- start:8783 stop:9286 length:504 start_codon:yes stop_codon:yes gene_type:complete